MLEQQPQIERVEFFFLDRRLLHDYSSQSTAQTSSATEILRDEIVYTLRNAGETDLAEAVAQIQDEKTLRAMQTAAHAANRTATATCS